jgi:hypothetical protein
MTIDSLNLSDNWQTLQIITSNGVQKMLFSNVGGQRKITVNVSELPAGGYIAILRGQASPAYIRFVKL